MSFCDNIDEYFVPSPAKRIRKSITLETKMQIINKMREGDSRANICRLFNLAPATVSTIMSKADKIIESVQNTQIFPTSYVTYTREPIMEKMEQLLIIWIEGMKERNQTLKQTDIMNKARNIYIKIQQDEGGGSGEETFTASRGWFERFRRRYNQHFIPSQYQYQNLPHQQKQQQQLHQQQERHLLEQRQYHSPVKRRKKVGGEKI